MDSLIVVGVSIRPALQVFGFGRTVRSRQVSAVVRVVLTTAHCRQISLTESDTLLTFYRYSKQGGVKFDIRCMLLIEIFDNMKYSFLRNRKGFKVVLSVHALVNRSKGEGVTGAPPPL